MKRKRATELLVVCVNKMVEEKDRDIRYRWSLICESLALEYRDLDLTLVKEWMESLRPQ